MPLLHLIEVVGEWGLAAQLQAVRLTHIRTRPLPDRRVHAAVRMGVAMVGRACFGVVNEAPMRLHVLTTIGLASLCSDCGARSESAADSLIDDVMTRYREGLARCGFEHQATQTELDVIEEIFEARGQQFEDASPETLKACRRQVAEYNACFDALSCSDFEADRPYPAWWAGVEGAPCGCGSEGTLANDGPFTRRATLPPTLNSCIQLLPLVEMPPRPLFECP